MIARQIRIQGSGKGVDWFELGQANVSYDHPFHVALEHALNIDFVNESLGPGARIAVELDADSARALAQAILVVLDQAGSAGFLPVEKGGQAHETG
jgi:hypothetical protein